MFDVVIRFSVYVDFVLMIQMQAIYLYFKLFFPSLNTFFDMPMEDVLNTNRT